MEFSDGLGLGSRRFRNTKPIRHSDVTKIIRSLSPPGVPILKTTASNSKNHFLGFKGFRGLATGAFVFSVLLLATTLTYPYNADCTLYSYMAWLTLQGHLPFLGSWAHNFPGIVLALIPGLLVLGRSSLAFHFYDVLIQTASLTLLYRILSRYDKRAGLLAIVFVSAYYVQQGFTFAGQLDVFATAALLLSIYLLQRRITTGTIIASALLCGWIVSVRPTYGLIPLVFAAALFIRDKNETRRWQNAASFLVWSAIPLSLFVGCYALFGHFHEIWESVILYNLRVYSVRGETFAFYWPLHYYYYQAIALVAAIVSCPKQYRRLLYLWIALMLASITSVVVTRKFAFYQYHPFMVLALGMASYGWVKTVDWIRATIARQQLKTSFQIAAYSLLVLYSLDLTFRGNTITHALRGIVQGKVRSIDHAYDYYGGLEGFDSIATYLKQRTHTGDRVQLIGQFLYPQFEAGLVSASRFFNINGLVTQPTDSTVEPFQIAWRKEFEDSVMNDPPPIILLSNNPMTISSSGREYMVKDIAVRDFPQLMQFIEQNYSTETTIDAVTIYTRKSSSAR